MSEPKKQRPKAKDEEDPTLIRDDAGEGEETEAGPEDTTVSRDEPDEAAGENEGESEQLGDADAEFHARIADDPTAVNLELRRKMLEETERDAGATEEIPEFSDDSTTILGVNVDDEDDLDDIDLDDAETTEVDISDLNPDDGSIQDDETTILAEEYSRRQQQTELAKTIQRPGTVAGTAGFAETEHLLGTREGILKGRFVLEERLGAGGMGTVYKARDLRKVEARDRNPYVAVKVLNDDFKRHPDAFIALQREAAKSQALSHPNIVRIYDFDKDGDTPFMTMEMLEGAELADMLRDATDGLPRDQGWKILRGICSGLQRAHEANITHSDFKPGNVFVTREGIPKILDFGIARAVHDTAGDEKAAGRRDSTLFDPGTLGALTPAYASLEMLNGEEPDPRDDIYGLALVAYLILTGKHPFDRKPADEAREERLKPRRIPRLTGRQWRAIERGLQFERRHRLGSVEEFSQLLFEKPRWAVRPAVAAAAVIAMVAVVAGSMMLEDAAQVNRDAIARQAMLDTRFTDIEALLDQDLFDERWEDQLFVEVQQVRSMLPAGDPRADDLNAKVLARYLEELRELKDDFDRARTIADRARRYTPDGQLSDEAELILADALKERIIQLFASAAFTPQWEQRLDRELTRARESLRDSDWVRDADKRALELYRMRATRAIDDGDLDEAERVIEGGARYADPASFAEQTRALADARELQHQREAQARREERERRLAAERREQALAAEQAAVQRDQEFRAALAPLEEELQCGSGFSMRRVGALVEELRAGFPRRFAAQESQIVSGVSGCIGQVMQSDAERARSFKRAALGIFPGAAELETIRFDPCGARYLVGSGNSGGRGGYCVDTLRTGESGPRLVVVPGTTDLRSFAIGKYEVSVAELNTFCARSSVCASRRDVDERFPATGVGLEVASAYLKWLSEQSGYVYRLPTVTEWRYAANADGSDPDPNRNCTLNALGIRKGDSLQNVRTGRGNAWGLVNHLGNVQEMALEESTLRAMGGAHVDAMGDCTPDLARTYSGAPDLITGFRVVRELR